MAHRPLQPYDNPMTQLLKLFGEVFEGPQVVTSRQASTPLGAVGTPTPGGGGGGNVNQIVFVSVADIDDPSAELNARTGDAAGSLLLVYQTTAAGVDLCTLYRTDSDNLTQATPWIIDSGDGKTYIGVCGRHQLPLSVLESFMVTNHDQTNRFDSSTLFTTTLCVITNISGGVTTTGKFLFDGISWERSSGGGISGTLVADTTTLTADRTWTLPDATGTVLLSSTAYTAMPAFANASRVHGSGSGGTSSIELVAERGLSIDANGIGLDTSQSPQFAVRSPAAGSDDTATSADYTIFLNNNGLVAHTADAYTPTGLAGKRLTYILTASAFGNAYTIRDHAAATLATLAVVGASVTITNNGTNWYVCS